MCNNDLVEIIENLELWILNNRHTEGADYKMNFSGEVFYIEISATPLGSVEDN